MSRAGTAVATRSRRAKIVCTLGPAVDSFDALLGLVAAGMDVARLNFSHGTAADHARVHAHVRRAADQLGRNVGVLADLQGPKIRLGTFADGSASWLPGEIVTITTEPAVGSSDRVSTTYADLPRDVVPGSRILVDDGNVALQVVAVDSPDVRCRVVEGGRVSDHKGMNLPGVRVSVPALTAKDQADLRFALHLPVDMVALSFVRSAADIGPVREVMAAEGISVPILAKIEKPEAVTALAEVLDAFDGVMIARGDLGVEAPLEQVPLVQKRAVQLARERAKPGIVATQMLESMITHSRPTRAEASDVANAVLDGADALMLSAETGVGAYPVQAVATMARIITAAEADGLPEMRAMGDVPRTRATAIAAAAVQIAATLGARALVAFTSSGDTARRLARHRPVTPLLAFTPDPRIRSQSALTWGVDGHLVPMVTSTDEMVTQVDSAMLELGHGQPGDLVVIVGGSPVGLAGTTNFIRVHTLGGA